MRPQAIRSPLPSYQVLSAILLNALWLSEMAMAHPDTPTSTDKTPSRIIRRATGSGPATVTVTPNADKKDKGLSLVVIIVIVIVVLVAILAIAGFAYWLYRGRSSKARKTKALNLPSIGIAQQQQHHSSSSSPRRPLSSSAARREPDWWQPSSATDGVETLDSHDHTIVPYSQGGHGYTYGRTLDVPTSTVTAATAGTRSSVGHQNPSSQGHVTEQDGASERPFQIPVLAPPPPPSISPSYHTYVGEGERSLSNPRDLDTIRSGHVYNPEPLYTGTYAAPTNPPPPPPPESRYGSGYGSGSFQPRPAETTLAYLQPQATGTSIYSNPYETSAMTQSTSGHPGT